MRILVTNDDSISAQQLLPLIQWCQKLGEVTTVVPLIEQSGKSHGIEIRNSFRVGKTELAPGIWAHTVDSTPADCIRYARMGLKLPYDLVISGINRGYNVGMDIMYSGTVAAVLEAGFLGTPAIALSTSPDYYEHAVEHLDEVLSYFKEHDLLKKHHIYNVNIPPHPKGVQITHQGGPFYSDDFVIENGMCTPHGKCVYTPKNDLTLDTDAVMSNYISIMPLAMQMTDPEIYRQLTQ